MHESIADVIIMDEQLARWQRFIVDNKHEIVQVGFYSTRDIGIYYFSACILIAEVVSTICYVKRSLTLFSYHNAAYFTFVS